MEIVSIIFNKLILWGLFCPFNTNIEIEKNINNNRIKKKKEKKGEDIFTYSRISIHSSPKLKDFVHNFISIFN